MRAFNPKGVSVPDKPKLEPALSKRETQELSMVLGQMGAQPLTEKQINTVLKQRDKAMDYQHKDTQKLLNIQADRPMHHKQILLGLGVIVLVLFVIVGIFDKQYIGDLIKVLFGFLGGSGAGYVYARSDNLEKD